MLVYQLIQCPRFCGLRRVSLNKIMSAALQLIIKSQYVVGGNQIDNAGRGHAVNLLLQDVADALLLIGERCFQSLAPVQPFDDLRNITSKKQSRKKM